jgi:hypothetical protein
MSKYHDFVQMKLTRVTPRGLDPMDSGIPMFPFQRDLERWGLRKGRAAIFANTGLGKTRMALAWGHRVAQEGDVLRFASGRDGAKGRHIGVKIGRDQVLHVSKQSVAIHSTRLFKFDAAFVLTGEPTSDDPGEGCEC